MDSQDVQMKLTGWLNEKEMQQISGFKTTKLWLLRQNGDLVSSKVGKKTYYQLDSYIELIEKNRIR